LLGFGGQFAGFLHGRVLVGLLHRFMESLLFVGGEWDGEPRVGRLVSPAFGGLFRTEVTARGVLGRKAKGGDKEQG
jgi:hypothetical protein